MRKPSRPDPRKLFPAPPGLTDADYYRWQAVASLAVGVFEHHPAKKCEECGHGGSLLTLPRLPPLGGESYPRHYLRGGNPIKEMVVHRKCYVVYLFKRAKRRDEQERQANIQKASPTFDPRVE